MNYLILLGIIAVFFYRALKLRHVVDDDIRYNVMSKHRSGESKATTMQWIRECCYGAGMFKEPSRDHLFTLAVHYANCCLIYLLTGSILASTLYMVNPVNNQTVLWLNGRRYHISILLTLIAWAWWPAALPAYAIIAWLHISAILLPILFLTTPFWLGVPLLGFVGWYFGKVKLPSTHDSRKSHFSNNEKQKITWSKAILYVKSVGWYFFHTIFPFKPMMWHEFLPYLGKHEKYNKIAYSLNFDFVKGLAALSFIGYELLVQHNFWALWFLLFISQWCNVYSVTMCAADRYCSLPGIGLMAIVAKYIVMLPAPFNAVAFAVLFTFYVARYQALFGAYKDTDSFYLYHINMQPDNIEANANLAERYMLNKDPFRAFAVIKNALKYRPTDFRLLLTMAYIMSQMGKYLQALKILKVAEKYVPIGEEEDCRKQFRQVRNDIAPHISNGKIAPGTDVEELMEAIRERRSGLSASVRATVEDVYEKIHPKSDSVVKVQASV